MSQFRVDSLGRPISAILPQGRGASRRTRCASRSTSKLQQAAENASRYGIDPRAAPLHGSWNANGGAIVALDPHDGSVRALASYPTYQPSLFVGRVAERA